VLHRFAGGLTALAGIVALLAQLAISLGAPWWVRAAGLVAYSGALALAARGLSEMLPRGFARSVPAMWRQLTRSGRRTVALAAAAQLLLAVAVLSPAGSPLHDYLVAVLVIVSCALLVRNWSTRLSRTLRARRTAAGR
jgi:hypothetical protein